MGNDTCYNSSGQAEEARQLARDLPGTTHDEFSAAFDGSPIKRAKLRGLERDAAAVLGTVGTTEDVDVVERPSVVPVAASR